MCNKCIFIIEHKDYFNNLEQTFNDKLLETTPNNYEYYIRVVYIYYSKGLDYLI